MASIALLSIPAILLLLLLLLQQRGARWGEQWVAQRGHMALRDSLAVEECGQKQTYGAKTLERLAASAKCLAAAFDKAHTKDLQRGLQSRVKAILNDNVPTNLADIGAHDRWEVLSPRERELEVVFDITDVLLAHSLTEIQERCKATIREIEGVRTKVEAHEGAAGDTGGDSTETSSEEYPVSDAALVLRRLAQDSSKVQKYTSKSLQDLIPRLEAAANMAESMRRALMSLGRVGA